jgi:hypothetical protein
VNTEHIGSLKITRMTHFERERQEYRTDLRGMRSKGWRILTVKCCKAVKVMTDEHRIVPGSAAVVRMGEDRGVHRVLVGKPE